MFKFPSKQPALRNWRLASKIPEQIKDSTASSYTACFKHFSSDMIDATLKINYELKNKEGKFKCVNKCRLDFT